MFTLIKPTEADVIQYLLDQRCVPYSYREVGFTESHEPRNYTVDHGRILIGHGAEAFEAAKLAIRNWKMFPTEMVELYWPDKPIEPGVVVAMLARWTQLWTLNPCRIVYIVADDPTAQVREFGFAYGTLPDHLERGEERFCVQWNQTTDEVHYDLLAYSQPQHLLAWIGYPVVRQAQARFRRLSLRSMWHAVNDTKESQQHVESLVSD